MKIFAALAILICSSNAATAQIPVTREIEITVTEKGFEPATLEVNTGAEITLKITRKTESTCATNVHIPSRKIKRELPLNKTIKISLGKVEKGEIRFACQMNMDKGVILVR